MERAKEMKRARCSAVAPPPLAGAAVPRPPAVAPPSPDGAAVPRPPAAAAAAVPRPPAGAAIHQPPVDVPAPAAAAPPPPAVAAVAPPPQAVAPPIRSPPYNIVIPYDGELITLGGTPADRRHLRRLRSDEELGGRITINPNHRITSFVDCVKHVHDAIEQFKEYMIEQGLPATTSKLVLTPRDTIPLSEAHSIRVLAREEKLVLNRTPIFKMKLKLYTELIKHKIETDDLLVRKRIQDAINMRSTVVKFL